MELPHNKTLGVDHVLSSVEHGLFVLFVCLFACLLTWFVGWLVGFFFFVQRCFQCWTGWMCFLEGLIHWDSF